MMRRDRRRNHAVPTARAKRIRSDAEREAAMRAADERDPSPWGGSPDRRTATAVLSTPARSGPRRRKRTSSSGSSSPESCCWLRSSSSARSSSGSASTPSTAATSSRVDALERPVRARWVASDRVNVLMIGYSGDPNHGGTYLADSLNILSIDPRTKTTTLIPIPRDLWIQGLPEIPHNGKVNEAFADGWDAGRLAERGRRGGGGRREGHRAEDRSLDRHRLRRLRAMRRRGGRGHRHNPGPSSTRGRSRTSGAAAGTAAHSRRAPSTSTASEALSLCARAATRASRPSRATSPARFASSGSSSRSARSSGSGSGRWAPGWR